MQQQKQPIFTPKQAEQINIREVLSTYLRHWPWIVLFTFISVGVAYLYVQSQNNVYRTTASVLVKDSKKGDIASELDIFADLGISKNQSNLHNEIEVLKSRPLIEKVVRSLNLNEQLTKEQSLLDPRVEFYGSQAPLLIINNINDSILKIKGIEARIVLESQEQFRFIEIDREQNEKNIGSFGFGETVTTSIGPLKLIKAHKGIQLEHREYHLSIASVKNAVTNYKRSLNVSPTNDDATVLTLSMEGQTPKRSEDFLNALVEQHEKQAIEDKNKITKHTSEFINERMKVIEEELSSVESEGEDFKTSKNLINVEIDAQSYLEKEGTLESEIMAAVIERNLIDFMNDYLKDHGELTFLLPANLGFSDEGINTMTGEYNKLVLERNKIVESASADNPMAKKLEGQIQSLRSSLSNSLTNLQESLKIKLKELQQKERKYQQKLSNIPEYERRYREIARQQQIKETLYLYLLQKREENEIAMASTVGNVKVVENAFTAEIPVSPKRSVILLGALLVGILIPIGFIYVRNTLDNKVHSRDDLEGIGIPVVAEIPKNKTKKYRVVQKGERSLVAEAFRMLRSNMNFLLPKRTEGGSVIFISSAIAGEGKTFNAINLANSLALIDKKVVLVGMDLRAPKITRYLEIEDGKGVTNYLVDNKLTLEDITVTSSEFENLDYVISGDVPPNPSELLMRPKVDELFAQLRAKYDYIIVDNAPTTLVVDAMSIVQHSDLFLYVVRANYLEKKILDEVKLMKEDEKVNNIAFILNDVDLKNTPYKGYGYGRYGYGYGYGSNYVYGEERKAPFWRRMFKR